MPSTHDSETLPECRERFERIREDLHEIRAAVCGNGKTGIVVRVDRLECAEEARRGLRRAMVPVIGGIVLANAVAAAVAMLKLYASRGGPTP